MTPPKATQASINGSHPMCILAALRRLNGFQIHAHTHTEREEIGGGHIKFGGKSVIGMRKGFEGLVGWECRMGLIRIHEMHASPNEHKEKEER